ncbi:Transcription initiation factor IIF, beta subunit domain containing protein [Rhypophila sp. PSN 637]
MAEPTIKPDPEAGSPFVEDEMDESTDLEFYDTTLGGGTMNRMYLARLPKFLWDAWATLDDDEEIEIGKIRQWNDKDGSTKLQMRLHPHLQQHKEIPKEYNMDIHDFNVNNTFVFTEQDLPSYAAKNKERAAALAQGIPAHLLRQQQKATEPQQPQERSRRGAPYTRRAIPKKTTIAGTIKHEVICTPVENAETEAYLTAKAYGAIPAVQAFKKRPDFMGLPLEKNEMRHSSNWDQFIKVQAKPTKAKKMENRTARWPENRLMDELARCFSMHKYWSLKAFRNKIPQPEAFIRECLEKIAELNRTGPFANHWSLAKGNEGLVQSLNPSVPADAAAPNPADDVASGDEDEEMVDIL